MIYGDIKNKLGWAYFTNSMSLFAIGDDPRYLALENAVYECVRMLEEQEQKEKEKK